MKAAAANLLVVAVSLALGCEVPELETSRSAAPSGQQVADASPSGDSKLFGKEDWYLPDGRVDMSGVEGEPPMTNGTPREIHWKDPKKGKLTRRDGGALARGGLNALPKATNETTFNMIKYNLGIYDADKSRFPRSHKEFMEDFLPNYYPAALPLPKLEPGDAYLYDPEDHLLKIFRPGDPGAPQVEGVVPYEAEPEDADEQ